MIQNKKYKALKKWLQIYRKHVETREQLKKATIDGTIRWIVSNNKWVQVDVKKEFVKSYCEAMDQQAKETIAEIRKMRRAAQLRKGVRVWK